VLYLAEAMAEQGEEVVIITTTYSQIKGRNVKVHAFPLPRIKVVSFIISFIWAFILTLVYAWFRKMRVLNLQWAYPLGPIGTAVKWVSPICLITTARGSDLTLYGNHPRWKKMIRVVLRSSDGVITVGSGLRAIALKLGVSANRCEVIASVGVDQEKFKAAKPIPLPGNGVKLLFVGGLVPVKGVDILLQACSVLLSKGMEFHLALVGKGPEEENVKQWINSLNLKGNVTLIGEVPHPQIASYFAAADIFVLPSRQEGLGIVLIEALASGTAIVASRTGGIPDLINDGENGILVNPENIQDLAQSLSELIQDEGLRNRLSQNGLKSVQRYTYEHAATETRKFMEQIIRKE